MMRCPSRGQLEGLLSQRLDATEQVSIVSHVEDCQRCQRELELLTASLLGDAAAPACDATTNWSVDQGTGALMRRAGTVDTQPSRDVAVPGYEVLGVLGRGGMGIVYKARQLGLGRAVALKMILSGEHAGPKELARFRREAEAVARLQHPNIVQIFEIGESSGRPYFSMELVERGTLAQGLHGEPLPARQAAQLVETLARAIHYAHERGVIHRDLKPANILLQEETTTDDMDLTDKKSIVSSRSVSSVVGSVPKISDFGLARTLGPEAATAGTEGILGTPSYMAPEQARGDLEQVGPAADVWALGALLYECLTGRPPFKGAGALDTLEQVRSDEPVPPRRLNPRVPRDLETVCLKCLHKVVPRRYGSARQLAEDLRRFQAGEPVLARPVSLGERAARWAWRRPAVAGLSAAVVVAVVTGLALVLWQWGRAEDRAAAEAAARADAEAAEARARQAERTARAGAARQALTEGLRLCEAGEADRGLLWLVHAGELVPEGEENLRRVGVANLAGWAPHVHPFRSEVRHADAVLAAAFGPQGRLLATGSNDETARLWETASGRPIGEPMKHANAVRFVAFAPSGTLLLTGSSDGLARFWDAATGAPRTGPLRHAGGLAAALFSPDGRLALTAGADGLVRLWDGANGEPSGPPLSCPGAVFTAAFSPDGGTIAVGCPAAAVLWDVAGRKQRGAPLAHPAAVVALAFGPRGDALVTGCADGTARLWDAASGKRTAGPLVHAALTSVALAPSGRLVATAGGDGTARLWDAASGQLAGPALVHTVGGSRTGELSVAFHPRGDLLVTTGMTGARLWDVPSGRVLGPPLRHPLPVDVAVFHPNGEHVLTGGRDGSARLWSIARQGPAPEGSIDLGPASHATVSPDGRLAVTAGEEVRLWSAADGKPLGALCKPHPAAVRVAFSGDAKVVLVIAGEEVSAWDLAQRKRLGPAIHLPRGSSFPEAFASHDGRLVLASSLVPVGTGARLFDTATGKGLGPSLPHPGLVHAAVFGRDSHTLLTAGETGTRFWDMEAGRPLPPLPLPGLALALSADGALAIVAGKDGVGRLWELDPCRPRGDPMRHAVRMSAAAFSPNGHALATGAADGSVRLWSAEEGAPLCEPLSHGPIVTGISFDRTGQTLLTAGGGRVRLWDTATALVLGPPWNSTAPSLPTFVDDGRKVLVSLAGRFVLAPAMPSLPEREPAPLRRWAETVTRQELDPLGGIHELSMEAWLSRGR